MWVRYIYIFFIWAHGQDKLEQFLVDFNKFHPSLKFTHESSGKNVTFLDVDIKFLNGQIITDLHIKATDRRQYLHSRHHILTTLKGPYYKITL